jgi:hypothetical protein
MLSGRAEAMVKPSKLMTAEASTSGEEACRSLKRSLILSVREVAKLHLQSDYYWWKVIESGGTLAQGELWCQAVPISYAA